MTSAHDRMLQVDTMLSHVWMVRAFLKHSDEAEDDDELRAVHRGLYDYSLSLGSHYANDDAESYFRRSSRRSLIIRILRWQLGHSPRRLMMLLSYWTSDHKLSRQWWSGSLLGYSSSSWDHSTIIFVEMPPLALNCAVS
jgi:hypothetical protein